MTTVCGVLTTKTSPTFCSHRKRWMRAVSSNHDNQNAILAWKFLHQVYWHTFKFNLTEILWIQVGCGQILCQDIRGMDRVQFLQEFMFSSETSRSWLPLSAFLLCSGLPNSHPNGPLSSAYLQHSGTFPAQSSKLNYMPHATQFRSPPSHTVKFSLANGPASQYQLLCINYLLVAAVRSLTLGHVKVLHLECIFPPQVKQLRWLLADMPRDCCHSDSKSHQENQD